MPSPKPIPGYPRTIPPASRQEPGANYRSFAQRFWFRFFVFGLITCVYGSLEFFGGRHAYPNLFDSPLYAPYIVFVGLFALCTGLVLRARVGE